jgi:Tol biopolymer transport system component
VSPSGKSLSFTVGNGTEDRQALYTSRLDGSHLRKIVPFRFNLASKQDWAPNGRRILFARLAGDSANVATIRPDGTGLRYLTHLHHVGVNAVAGSYSPNGRWVLIRRENLNKERFRLVKMHPNGSDRR